MAEVDDEILDPAHADEGTNMGAAGMAAAEQKNEDKDELKLSEDGNVAEHKGVKYVRQEALHAAREKNKELASVLAQIEPVMPEFQEFLRNKQGRQAAVVDRARDKSDSDYTDDELEGFAVTRGYQKDDGSPDTARAKAELDIISGVQRRITSKAVEPVRRGATSEQARLNRERAHGRKFVDGAPIADEKYLNAALDALPDEYLADPNVANITQIVAAGLEYLDLRKNGTLRGRRSGGGREPMYVERGSGRFDGDEPEISDFDRAAARARGKSIEEWMKTSKAVNKRTSDVLEDI